MNTGEAALKKLQEYVETINSKDYGQNALDGLQAYEDGLKNTQSELNEQLSQEKAKSELLRNSIESPLWDEVSPDPNERLRQLQVISSAFRSLAESEPLLPSTASLLPTLLATREVQRLVSETKDSVFAARTQLEVARQDLSTEQSDLSDALLLTKALESRIGGLRAAASQKAKQTSDEAAKLLLAKEREHARSLAREHKKLTSTLGKFVDSKLAPLIAAEELGGPVAGTTLDISEDVLAAGFDVKGKQNKSKKKLNEDARQQRIDKMFAAVQLEENEDIADNETKQAAFAVKELLGELLQVAIDHGSGRYITLEKESAVSRFLVRAKAATLDPRDARRIRLIDFAKTLED